MIIPCSLSVPTKLSLLLNEMSDELSTRIFFGQTRQFAPGSIAVRCGIYLSRGIEKVVTILLGNLIVTGRFVRR